MALDKQLQCSCCGRDFAGYSEDADIFEGARCPSDDCPSHDDDRMFISKSGAAFVAAADYEATFKTGEDVNAVAKRIEQRIA